MKIFLLTIVFALSGILTSVAQAQLIPQAEPISLSIDSTQSSVGFSVGGSSSTSQVSGDANIDLQFTGAPAGDAQITDLNLVLDEGISVSFALGLLTGATSPGDVSLSLVTPGSPGTISGTSTSFNQLANSLMLGGDLNIIDAFGVAGGSQTIDLSAIELAPADFNSVEVTQVGDVITVSGSFSLNETLNLPVGPTPLIVSGTFVASGEVPVSIILGDVDTDGLVTVSDIQPFIAILATGEFQGEADINQNGVVNFLDISPFIDILLN